MVIAVNVEFGDTILILSHPNPWLSAPYHSHGVRSTDNSGSEAFVSMVAKLTGMDLSKARSLQSIRHSTHKTVLCPGNSTTLH